MTTEPKRKDGLRTPISLAGDGQSWASSPSVMLAPYEWAEIGDVARRLRDSTGIAIMT